MQAFQCFPGRPKLTFNPHWDIHGGRVVLRGVKARHFIFHGLDGILMTELSEKNIEVGGKFSPVPVPRVLNAGLRRPDSRKSIPRPDGLLLLDKNENTDPALKAWLDRIQARISAVSLSTYPDLGPLYAELSNWLGVPSDQLVLTTGSDGAIHRIFEMFVEPNDAVLLTQPTFAMYEVYANAFGARVHSLEYERTESAPKLDLNRILTAIEELRPRLFCLPNPDSPTGNVLSLTDLEQVIRACGSAGTVLLIDEAYHPFTPITAVPFVASNPHVLIARTFSKAWGLAGLRTGYLVGHPETIEWFHRTRPMYEIGEYANAFLSVAIKDHAEMTASVARLTAGKIFFAESMTSLGFRMLASGGNFQHVAFGDSASRIHSALRPFALYRADSDFDCLRGFSRFSSTTRDLFSPIVDVISDYGG